MYSIKKIHNDQKAYILFFSFSAQIPQKNTHVPKYYFKYVSSTRKIQNDQKAYMFFNSSHSLRMALKRSQRIHKKTHMSQILF